MEMTAKQILRSIQGAKIAYTQSDEISILITDYDTIETDAWFGYNVQKMCSVSASICTALFNTYYNMHVCHDEFGFFDSRVFNIPKEEVVNYFIWRQQDCMRNSVQMCAQYLYSQKQLNGLNVEKMKQMLMGSDFDWNILQPRYKYGTFVSMLDGSNDMCESHDVVLSNKNMFDEYLGM
jgi:tRNA(His) 5'-end guanylyltransferase